MRLVSLLNPLWNLLFPPLCLRCNREGAWLCSRCSVDAPRTVTPWCPLCGKTVSHGTSRHSALHVDGFVSCVPYHTDWVERGIQQLKFHGVEQIATMFGSLLAACLRNSVDCSRVVVTHVPVHKRRFRERGFDQTAAIARACAHELDLPYLSLLQRTRKTVAQSSLEKAARTKNVAGAFALASPVDLTNTTVVLVDDVVTTGATLSEAAKPLRTAGAACILAATVAYSVLQQRK